MNANPLSTVDAPALGSDVDVESFMIEYYGAVDGFAVAARAALEHAFEEIERLKA